MICACHCYRKDHPCVVDFNVMFVSVTIRDGLCTGMGWHEVLDVDLHAVVDSNYVIAACWVAAVLS